MNCTILIDNGHGQETPGKRSPDGKLMEWDFTRKVATRMLDYQQDSQLKMVLLVPENKDVALSTRAERANDYIRKHPNEKCILYSIHGNAAGNGAQWMSARGWEAWTTVGKTNSDKLSEELYSAASAVFPYGTRLRTDNSDGDRDKEKNFTVIFKAACPAVLTENFFYDNKEDCSYMLTDDGIDAIARVHIAAAKRYFQCV